jgi:hypothetical protein
MSQIPPPDPASQVRQLIESLKRHVLPAVMEQAIRAIPPVPDVPLQGLTDFLTTLRDDQDLRLFLLERATLAQVSTILNSLDFVDQVLEEEGPRPKSADVLTLTVVALTDAQLLNVVLAAFVLRTRRSRPGRHRE